MKQKKIVLLGAGNIARTHAAVLRETPGLELYGVFANPGTAFQGQLHRLRHAMFRQPVHLLRPQARHLLSRILDLAWPSQCGGCTC